MSVKRGCFRRKTAFLGTKVMKRRAYAEPARLNDEVGQVSASLLLKGRPRNEFMC